MEHTIIELLLGPLGLTVALIFTVFGLWRQWWVPGWLYRKEEKDKEEWKEAALRGTRVAERAVTIHEASERREVRREQADDETI